MTQVSTALTRIVTQPGLGLRLGVVLALMALAPSSAGARVHHNDAWAREEFAQAERTREALNGRPLGERTRREYQRVIDSYRRVYFGSPASSKADPSVVATAELMVEMGRRFDDNKILRDSVEQYRFLRKEYPGSKYRFDALFTIGEIYKDDLDDPEEARTTFENFLHRYPRNRLADDARAAVKEIDAEADEMERSAQTAARKGRTSEANASSVSASDTSKGHGSGDGEPEDASAGASARRSALPRVTGVRHWSTPDYTRVAIDVEQEVKFGSHRISHPDRIFFDLRDTKLASTLVGKTFDVDDGFLKKIRVAEFEPGRTRIVLEVDDLASYDAFLLPDPYRLIIDVHGKEIHGKDDKDKADKDKDVAGKQKATTLAARAEPTGSAAHSHGDTAAEAVAAADSEDDSGEPVAFNQDAKPDGGKQESDSGGDAIRFAQSEVVETDLPAEKRNTEAKAADSAAAWPGIGVIKTTVAVKGTNRRIPKTIVEADDRVPSTVAVLEREKLRPEVTAADGSDAPDAGSTKPSKEDSLALPPTSSLSSVSSSSSAAAGSASPLSSSLAAAHPSHRKKPRTAAAAASDTGDLRSEGLETREARPTAAGDRSLIRALGLKIGKIVIDAGHGGHDTGTIGPNGLLEKEVVLDVAKRLGRLLESRLGAQVIYTRQDDTFIPLETRTAIANRERADLFISIHANSSHDPDARGVETYYLNFTSSPEALEVAARENAVSEKSIHELQDLVKKIALKEKIDESREFAGDVQESLYGGLALNNAGVHNRGIKKAPFIVLIGANMPSILAEISFVSNPADERKLETSEHRQRIAESLYRGVSKYVSGLSGVKVASKIDKGEGQ